MDKKSTSLLALILTLAAGRVVAADWTDTRVAGPFVCRADFSLAGSERVLDELGQLQADLIRALGIPPAGEKIEVYLFHDKATYVHYFGHYMPGVPYRRAIFAKGRGPGRVFAYKSDQFEIDLRHECTHALLHAALADVPLWLDEGLAGYFELPAEQRASGNPHLRSVVADARRGVAPSIEALEKKRGVADMGRAEYRDSWAWTHFMLHGPAAAHEELVAYLTSLRTAANPSPKAPSNENRDSPPLSIRLNSRMGDLRQRFCDHFSNWR